MQDLSREILCIFLGMNMIYLCKVFESVSVILYFMVENMGRVENDNVDGLYEFM